MQSRRMIHKLIFVLLVCLVLAPAMVTSAQNAPLVNTLSMSEGFINDALRANNPNAANDLSIDLQSGQFLINLTVTAANGNVTYFSLTVVPAVVNGNLQLDATRLTINELEINLNNSRNPAVDAATGTVDEFLGGQIGDGQIQTVLVTDNLLQITWLNPDPNAPAVTIADYLFSLTFTEASINALPGVTNPSGPYVSAVNVDLQPGQAVVLVTRTIEPAEIRYTYVPTVVNGIVTWQVSTEAGFENGLAPSLATLWSAYFDGIYREGTLSNTVITDDRITFTWDLTPSSGGPTGDPVVTYTTTENEVNAALVGFTSPELTALAVDMQPGRVIITAAGVSSDGVSYLASLTLLPVLANGTLSWQTESFSFNGIVVETGDFAATDQSVMAMTQGFGESRFGGTVTSITIDDSAMTITVRY